MSQLTISSAYKNRLVQRFIAWFRDTGITKNGATATAAAALAAACFVAIALRRSSSSSSKTPVPFAGIPTPKGRLPVVGHMLAIAGTNTVAKFHEWHQELGPVFYLRIGVKNILVLGDPYMTHEILATNGKVTSHRPFKDNNFNFSESGNRGIVAGYPEEKQWSRLRKSVLNALGPRMLKEVSPVLCKEADEFVDLVASGENVFPLPALMRVSLNFILITLFGIRTKSTEDPLYKRLIRNIDKFIQLTDFKDVAKEFIPALVLLDPIIGSNTAKRQYDFLHYECKPVYLELIEKGLDSDQDNMSKQLNQELNQGKRGYYDNMLATIHDMITAGTDTTAVTMSWAFLQISTRPEIQKKIQQEIDVFVKKNGRLPEFWERDQVPYMIATQRECFRLRSTTEFGVPHSATEDFEWRGTLIPKDTMFMANMCEVHMNPTKYPNPEEFRPERFLNQEDTMVASANRKAEDRDQFNFGWGRRLCVGAHLAETQMFNVWVRVLYKCNIKPALDGNGNEIPLTLETVAAKSGPVVVGPSHFEIRFVPRAQATTVPN